MSISIKNIRSATPTEWDYIWQQCDYSTYFHSGEWAEIWNIYTKGKMRPDPKLVIFTDGKKALLPLSYQRSLKGLAKNYISSPAGTFGGWISADDISVGHAVLMSKFLTKKLGNLVWRINPYDELVFKSGVQASEDDETHALNLESGFDAISEEWARRPLRLASKVRKARRAGVSVKLASTLEEWRLYYHVYEDSLRRWGNKATSRYDWGIFHDMFERHSRNIKLWLAIYEDEVVVAGVITFYAKKHVVSWHGATLEEYFNLRPVNLLMHEVIKNACKQRYTWFDFNPSGGHEGTKAFKKSFGAKGKRSPVVHVETKSKRIIKKISSLI